MLHRLPAFLALFTAAAFLAGCLQATQKVTVNPDMTGKTEFEYVQQLNPPGAPAKGQTKPPSPEDMTRAAMIALISNSKNVEAFSGLKWEPTADGKARLQGTAYFADATQPVQIGNYKVNLQMKKTDDKTLTIAINPAPPKSAKPANPPTAEQVDKQIAQTREQWAKTRAMTEAMFKDMRFQYTFILPGTVTSASNFKKVPGGVYLDIQGAKIFQAMDKAIADDAAMRKALQEGKSAMEPADAMEFNKEVFGEKGPVQATIALDAKPLFDYKAELEKAREESARVRAELGLTK